MGEKGRLKVLPHYTYEDYRHWEGRWELIGGVPYAMAPIPRPRHQLLSSRIARLLDEALERAACPECVALLPVDWKISEDTVVQPDNLVVCGDLPEEDYLSEPPVLIFEVLSPSTLEKDRVLKFRLYEEVGVKYYVMVDPERLEAEIFENKGGRFRARGTFQKESFTFDLGPCRISFDFARLFAVVSR
ncbi:Uma2 family endonuclease [Thermosulfurimonas marina]|uniref:Uma2 family endonuclease n=1 Tax=Thermosulfurimonas marina TaxID=2047767 RepID=A0A6H1WT02_9BACT|nr:Uma2 family endonuclease [Thermosulfurimonas marina]QJA06301.1 Uma2 family endonuclease [Thermosulfurimonas marina]